MSHLIIEEREGKLRPIRVSQANEENRMMNIAKNDMYAIEEIPEGTNWRDSRRQIVPGDRKSNKLQALQIISWVKARANVNITTTEPDDIILPHSSLCKRDIATIIIFEIEKLRLIPSTIGYDLAYCTRLVQRYRQDPVTVASIPGYSRRCQVLYY